MLEIKNLTVKAKNDTPILTDVSLSIDEGTCIGLTGASGSGKTTLIKSIMGMNSGDLEIAQGQILLDGDNLLIHGAKERRALCGKTIGFIPQNPMTAFFPHAKMERQIIETLRMHTGLDKKQAHVLAENVLRQVNLTDVGGIEVIKAFNQSANSYQKYSDAVNDDASYAVDWMKDTQLFMSMSNTIWPSVWLAVLSIGAVLYQHGTLSAPVFLTIMILSLGIVGPILGAIKFTDNISQLGTIVGEVGNLLDAPEMVRPDHDADIHNQSIQFQDVSFSYDLNDSKPILDHINLTIQPGTMTALVGPSGSGKSTITKLITGFWEATSGTISLGGVDLKNIPLSQLSSYVSYVSQDNYLFDESIRENIRMGRLSATDQEVEDVARKCGCHDFIMGLEHGYDTIVGGAGGHLSGGERQRIAIARAMLKDAPIIIFDEATAYLDPENESLIQEAISKLVQGKTLIMVAHRLYTVTGADQLVVVNQGRIEATGTHEELLKKCPLYKEMWQAHIGSRDEGGATA